MLHKEEYVISKDIHLRRITKIYKQSHKHKFSEIRMSQNLKDHKHFEISEQTT